MAHRMRISVVTLSRADSCAICCESLTFYTSINLLDSRLWQANINVGSRTTIQAQPLIHTIQLCIATNTVPRGKNKLTPRRDNTHTTRYIVLMCAKEARTKQVLQLNLSSIKAGHHRAEHICTMSRETKSGGYSGTSNRVTRVVTNYTTHRYTRYLDLGLPFKSVSEYQDDALGLGSHVMPSHRCDHMIYRARAKPHIHPVNAKKRNIRHIWHGINGHIQFVYYVSYFQSMGPLVTESWTWGTRLR